MDIPKVSVWITSTGRLDAVRTTIEDFIEKCTYPNYEVVIIESQMTPESSTFFNLDHIKKAETEEYLRSLPEKHSGVAFKIFIQDWKRLGEVYNQQLANTSGYFINLEDDAHTVADPSDQFTDAIKMLQDDPKLLGLRMDLRDDSVYEGSPRFKGTKEAAGIKFVYWDFCSGGAQFMDASKVRALGGYLDTHPIDKYGQTEIDQTKKMLDAEMYIGVSLKYYGFWAHMSSKSVQGADRQWSRDLYDKLTEKGWYGDGAARQPL